ncbi:hypothetical protein KQY10_17640 [Leptospira interrogans]|uniref:Transposase n=1 Tax=Leptospira interrogans serovar Hardjo str. Norma TaxID=1279460 RepID=A0A0M4MRH1_LEPIR|nr:transposase [Leptospira interrogans serovar Hardjo str. Norma]MCD1167387.1 hypothetical protein [Leptospira interrogans]
MSRYVLRGHNQRRRKNTLIATDMLDPLVEEEGARLLRSLTDRGAEYFRNREHHEFQLFLALEDIDHSKTKKRHP